LVPVATTLLGNTSGITRKLCTSRRKIKSMPVIYRAGL
jgi:hypothetical protein